MDDIIKSFEAGVGGTLGHIALVIGLGTMLAMSLFTAVNSVAWPAVLCIASAI